MGVHAASAYTGLFLFSQLQLAEHAQRIKCLLLGRFACGISYSRSALPIGSASHDSLVDFKSRTRHWCMQVHAHTCNPCGPLN
jgi:hypothetical protein